MSPKLKETVGFMVGMMILVVLMAAMFMIIGGCAHQKVAITPATRAGHEDQPPEMLPSVISPYQTTPYTPSGNSAVQLAPIHFDFDRHDIRPDQRPVLAQSGDMIVPGSLVTLEGHCDERGTSEYNLALGMRRAYSVRNYLTDIGVLAEFRCVSFGEDRPIDPNHNEAAWEKNRRVEFK